MGLDEVKALVSFFIRLLQSLFQAHHIFQEQQVIPDRRSE